MYNIIFLLPDGTQDRITCATLRTARSYHNGLVASGYEVLTEEPF